MMPHQDPTQPDEEANPPSDSPRLVVICGCLAFGLTAVFCALPALGLKIGVAGEWSPHMAKHPGSVAWATCAVTSLLVSGLCAWAFLRDVRTDLRVGLLTIVLVQAIASLNFLTFACAGPYGVIELCTAIITSGANGSYYAEAERIGAYASPAQKRDPTFPHYAGLSDYLARYAHDMPKGTFADIRIHVSSHPPGHMAAMYLVHTLLRRAPGLVSSLRRAYRRWLPAGEALFVAGQAESARLMTVASVTIALCWSLFTSTTVLLAYWAGCVLGLGRWRWLCAGLVAQMPTLLLFNPGVDAVQAPVALFAALLTFWALPRRGAAWSVVAGLVASAATIFSLALVAVAALGALAGGCMFMRSSKTERRTVLRNTMAYVLAGLCLWPLVWLVVGYNHFAVLWQCRSGCAAGQATRAYWPWVGMNLFTWLAFMGGAAAAVGLAGVLPARGRGSPGACFSASACVIMLLLLFSGQTRGEVERLWAFTSPLWVLAGASGLARVKPSRLVSATAAALLLLQSIQAVAYRVFFDVWSTAP